MKALTRYLPLVLLAVAWEATARLELVSSSALPPLSDIVVSWFDMLKTGELATNAGASLYRRRSSMIEPVFADTKFNRKIDRFLRRGRAACRSEWRLITATHNLLKLHRHALTVA